MQPHPTSDLDIHANLRAPITNHPLTEVLEALPGAFFNFSILRATGLKFAIGHTARAHIESLPMRTKAMDYLLANSFPFGHPEVSFTPPATKATFLSNLLLHLVPPAPSSMRPFDPFSMPDSETLERSQFLLELPEITALLQWWITSYPRAQPYGMYLVSQRQTLGIFEYYAREGSVFHQQLINSITLRDSYCLDPHTPLETH